MIGREIAIEGGPIVALRLPIVREEGLDLGLEIEYLNHLKENVAAVGRESRREIGAGIAAENVKEIGIEREIEIETVIETGKVTSEMKKEMALVSHQEGNHQIKRRKGPNLKRRL